jgi:hypothetical protein
VSCVKLPAAVAFPTDGRLLQRIEESRRALPANNMKPLWKSRELAPAPGAPSAPRERGAESPSIINVSLATVGRLPARAEDPCKWVVPLARTTRARDGISVSAA